MNRKTKECSCCMEPEESIIILILESKTVCNSILWLLNRLHFSSRMTRLEWKTAFGLYFLVGVDSDHLELVIH